MTKLYFAYTYLNNEASSNVMASFGDADMSLRNTEPGCTFESNFAYLENDERETKILANFRMTCKDLIYQYYKIVFKDVINARQIKTAGFDDSKVMDFLVTADKNKAEKEAQKAAENEAKKAAEKEAKKDAEPTISQNTTAKATTTKTNNKNSLKQENELKWVPADWKSDSQFPEDAKNYWRTSKTSWTVFHASDPAGLKKQETYAVDVNEPLYGFEAAVKKTKGSEEWGLGFIFGASEKPTRGYMVAINTSGKYSIKEITGNKSTKLVDWEYLDAFKTGLNVEHKIKCQLVNENKDWEIYVDDNLVYTIKDSKYKAGTVSLVSSINYPKLVEEKPVENRYKFIQFYK